MLPVTEDRIIRYITVLAASYTRDTGLLFYKEFAWVAAAERVLIHYLGVEWCNRHVWGRGSEGGSSFLRSQVLSSADDQCWPDKHRHQERTVQLANMLLNFESVEGVDGRISRLLSEDVEACVADLSAAECLYRQGIPFRFVKESGVVGADYDIEATLGQLTIPCEVKCKIESTSLTNNTIKEALNKARRQLPPDKPGIVFLAIPETWTTDATVGARFRDVLTEVFRNTGRISAVVVLWEEWRFKGQESICVYRTHIVHNPYARRSLTQLEHIIAGVCKKPKWRTIQAILGGQSPEPFYSFFSTDISS